MRRLLLEALEADRLQIPGQARSQLARRQRIVQEDLPQDVGVRGASKWRPTGQHLVQNRSQSVDVGPRGRLPRHSWDPPAPEPCNGGCPARFRFAFRLLPYRSASPSQSRSAWASRPRTDRRHPRLIRFCRTCRCTRITLPGFRSRCSTPRRWAWSMPSASSATILAATFRGHQTDIVCGAASESVVPSQYSSAIQQIGPASPAS